MAIFKCKMCGGSLDVAEGTTVCECEYCGTQQTIPKLHDEVMTNLFNRANHLRSKCEFDKAQEIYEKIISQNPTEAEAYWGIILCKYGIEYVEDPATFRKIPTCHRTQLESVQADADYLSALQNADTLQKEVYEREAAEIDRLQRDILSIVRNEKPFDVFICYKETDDSGKRTQDSVIANDIYHQLTQEGFKVFYAAITLEDKLGEAYEPYIFAALNSAKVMLVLGTKPEYFTAVWVRNEWSRYLQLAKKDHSRLLIPCYRDMDTYDLPEEFSHLQAQDMGKIGFINDVIRGIKKVMEKPDEQKPVEKTSTRSGNANIASLLKRAKMFLEDGDFNNAIGYSNKVLDIDPECSQAYYFLLMAQLHIHTDAEFENATVNDFGENVNFVKALRFADEQEKERLKKIKERVDNNRTQKQYDQALELMHSEENIDQWYKALECFMVLIPFSDSLQKMVDTYDRIFEFIQAKADAAEKEHIVLDVAKQFEHLDRYRQLILDAAKARGWFEIESRLESLADCKAAAQACRENAEKMRIYDHACGTLKNDLSTIEELETAKKSFESIPEWSDAKVKAEACEKRIEELNARERARQEDLRQRDLEFQKAEKRKKTIILIAIIAVILVIIVSVIVGSQKNKKKRIAEAQRIAEEQQRQEEMFLSFPEENKVWLAAGYFHTVGVNVDGTVVATGDNGNGNGSGRCDVSNWIGIVAVAAGGWHTVGLKADGTVVATGEDGYGESDVSDWTDIVAVSAGEDFTIGLKEDGTVVATGNNEYGQCDVSDWRDIVAVAAGDEHTVGLKADGTVVAAGHNLWGRCDVSDWRDIVDVAVGNEHTVGLKADGTVVATGDNFYGQCDVSDWRDIEAVAAGYRHTVGLKADGTVEATGDNDYGQCDVSDWSNIVDIAAGYNHTVGLKADGTVVATGDNDDGQCYVSDWTNIGLKQN